MKLVVFIAVLGGWLSAQELTTRSIEGKISHLSTDERIQTDEKRLASVPASVPAKLELIAAYLQKVRETGDFSYLVRADKLVDRILTEDSGNESALRYRNEIDLQRHEFAKVADRAASMAKYNPSDPGIFANLGDALMELGEYDRANQAYTRMFALRPNLASYNRLAWHRFVTGHPAEAIALMNEAVQADSPLPENTAWCLAELGDMYFKTGKVAEAKRAYSSALQLFPSLHRALAGIARIDDAEGRVSSAIRNYEHAQSIIPLPEYAGALEDLYMKAGQPKKAAAQRDLIGTIDTLAQANGEKANRNLALVLADHDRNLNRALAMVEAEREVRNDVYTWDALAWVLFKAHRVAEAAEADHKALAYGTPEPSFCRHALAISAAAGVTPPAGCASTPEPDHR